MISKQPRVAFYPCCARDVEQPLRLLQGFVDVVVFCDINSNNFLRVKKLNLQDDQSYLPKPNCIVADARQAIRDIEHIDVLFYRRDGMGEGGSGILVLSPPFLLYVLERMTRGKGLIITDGSNHGGHWYRAALRSQGTRKFGWHFQPAAQQPFLEEGLQVIRCERLTETAASTPAR